MQEVHEVIQEFVSLGEREEYNMNADDAVNISMFNHDRHSSQWKKQRLSFLHGARKYFSNGAFHLANSPHKSAVIAMILMELYCIDVGYNVNMNTIPTCFTVSFSGTSEVMEAVK